MYRCAICDGSESRSLLRITEPDRFEQSIGVDAVGYERHWVECARCGTATNILPEMSKQRLSALRSAYYEVDFQGSDIGEKYRRVMNLPAEQSDNAGRVARIVAFSGRWFGKEKNLRVMDIGAGTGVFLSRLVDVTKGEWEYLGVEPDPRAAEHLRGLSKFSVVEAMYVGQPDLRGFSIVTLNKVLEHIERPLPFLIDVCKSVCSENGLVYVEVPDKVTLSARSPNDNILGSLHCHLYDPISLAYLLRCAGLEILSTSRIAEPSGKLSVFAFAVPAKCLAHKDLPHE